MNLNDISNRISSILSSKGMKQKDLADLLDKSDAEVSKYLSGNHNFTVKTILKIEQVLGEKILGIAEIKSDQRIFKPLISYLNGTIQSPKDLVIVEVAPSDEPLILFAA